MQKLIPVLLAVLVVGCSSSRVFQTAGPLAPGLSISDVHVTSDKITGDAKTFYNANSMDGAIRVALVEELRRVGKVSNDGPVMEFEVTDFRLRSGTEVAWLGVMAGSDYMAGTVTVKKGESVLKTFAASAKDSESFWSGAVTGRVAASSRADLFCRMIAKKIAEQL